MNRYNMVPYTDIDIDSGFWAYRQQLNREVTTGAVMRRFQDTGRFDAFRLNWREGMPNKPHYFWDSDIAKWMEGVAYLLKKGPAPEYEAVLEETIDRIEAGQGKDGYFNIFFTNIEPTKRFSNRDWHELYCAGHLIEAAVAYDEATGRDRFLKIMMKYADYIDRVFREENSAAFMTPGHEELELALVKLYRHTGEKRYLDLSKFFIDNRGANDKDKAADTPEHKLRLFQSHAPVREMTTAEGHAVRAGYLYSAMADIARETQDETLLAACKTLFENIVTRRMYITGGVGSGRYGEAYTVDFDLPNELAYTETCAAIALAYFARRMLTMDADSVYADVVETILYNGFLSSTSLDGKRFFYTNPMAISVRDRSRNVSADKYEWLPAMERVEVFGCSCCPPNITRFVASVAEYMYTTDEKRIFVHQFMGSNAEFGVGGKTVRVRQTTDYPTGNTVRFIVENGDGVQLAVRIPGWCRKFSLSAGYKMEKGYAVVDCAGDAFELTLTMEMEPELIEANPEVQANAGRVALRRGPVVYCIEAADNGERIQDIRVDAQLDAKVEYCDTVKMPVVIVRGWRRKAEAGSWLYRPVKAEMEEMRVKFIPYYAFANRGPSDMQVWNLLK
ncbi:MAG: glycoside hydrolase family 127 protein [Clostridia bacterium]|nr:glycoside hydrolase family 127 protein [Clostridia bacterium]